MYLRSIEMKNFRCFEKTLIEPLNMVNVFAGLNGEGKSTILDAIAVALTGTCRGAETGRNLGDLRRTGSRRKWEVTLTDNDGNMIPRREGEGPKSATQDAINTQLGFTEARAAIRACLYSTEILRMKPAEAQALMLDLAQPAAVKIPIEYQELLINWMKRDVEEAGTAEVGELYAQAYDRRREVGSELRTLGEVSLDVPDALKDKTLSDLEDLDLRVTARVKEIENEAGELQLEVATLDRKGEQLEDKLARIDAALADIGDLDDTADEIKADTSKLLQQLADATEARKLTLAKLATTTERVAEAKGDIKAIETYAQQVGKDIKACPMCTTKLQPAKLKALRLTLKERMGAVARGSQKDRMELGKLKENEVEFEKVQGSLEREIAKVERREQHYIQNRDRLAKCEAMKEAVQAEIKAHGKTLKADREERLAKMGALEDRAKQGREKQTMIREAVVARKAMATHGDRYANLKREQDDLDALVKGLSPTGPIQAELAAGDEVAAFEGQLLEIMALWGYEGVSIAPRLSEGKEPLVWERPARLLSDAQRTLFGVAFQIATATVTKIGMVAIDNLEHLDPATSGKVLQLLRECTHQSFVFKVQSKDLPSRMPTDVSIFEVNARETIRPHGEEITV